MGQIVTKHRTKRALGALLVLAALGLAAFLLLRAFGSAEGYGREPAASVNAPVDSPRPRSQEQEPAETEHYGPVTELHAAELEAASDADLRREIESRAALNTYYKIISDNIERYPREALELALRNSEAAAFAAAWPEYAGRRYSADSIDISGDLRAGELPYFLQWDERWGCAPYGSGSVAISGCGPTCLAMVAAGLTGDTSVNPLAVADYSAAQGWYFEGYGTDWELMRTGAEHFGLRWQELPLDEARIRAALDAGEPVIASMGPGDFTDAGHYIVLRAYENGGFRVLDSNSPDNSAALWSYGRISSQIRNLWAYTNRATEE